MKKHTLAVSILLGLSTFAAAAETPPYESWIGGFWEYYNSDGDVPVSEGVLDDGFGLGAEFGYRFNPTWAIRFEASHLKIDRDTLPLDEEEEGPRMGLDAMLFAKDDLFYLFAGLKHLDVVESTNVGNLGLGKHWQISDRVRIITETAAYHDFGQGYRDWGVKIGLAYTFGGSGSASGDSDKDGVVNSLDACPGTPAGSKVDSKGCDIDLDRDGVPNDQDQCPNTPAGTPVDATGCNRDKDGDGVPNDQDRCPNTPAGTKVGSRGCNLALDTDQDGVVDSQDKCFNTPVSDKVDSMGCSIFTEQEVTAILKVLFANNSSEISNPDDDQFKDFADFMARFPNTKAMIEGHSSAAGEADYNQWLSEQRAAAVRKLLIDSYNIDASRLSSVGYGETRLLDESATVEAARINRRIEAKVTAIEKVKVLKDD